MYGRRSGRKRERGKGDRVVITHPPSNTMYGLILLCTSIPMRFMQYLHKRREGGRDGARKGKGNGNGGGEERKDGTGGTELSAQAFKCNSCASCTT